MRICKKALVYRFRLAIFVFGTDRVCINYPVVPHEVSKVNEFQSVTANKFIISINKHHNVRRFTVIKGCVLDIFEIRLFFLIFDVTELFGIIMMVDYVLFCLEKSLIIWVIVNEDNMIVLVVLILNTLNHLLISVSLYVVSWYNHHTKGNLIWLSSQLVRTFVVCSLSFKEGVIFGKIFQLQIFNCLKHFFLGYFFWFFISLILVV